MKRIKKLFIIVLLTGISLLLILNTASSQETAGQLFEKALYLEEGKGELQPAIELYLQILDQYPADREVAAKSLLHLGMCYEKLGKQEAKKAYRQVIQKYPDQNYLVTEARARLAALEKKQSPALTKGMAVRKVWADSDVDIMGEPSPDGKYISYVDWDTGDLAIYEIATGKKRRLTNKGSWDDPNEFAYFSRWSPNGKQIVYDWYNNNNPALINLYIIGLDGSEPRLLYSNEEMFWTQCYDWSPDGKQILAGFIRKDKRTQIGLVSTADGSVRILKLLGRKMSPMNMRFSPDGRFIVYDIQQEEDTRASDIYLLSIDGSSETSLVEHPSNDILLDWSPDGKSILFGSERNGTLGFWSIQVAEGKPQGDPKLVKPDMGPIVSLGFIKRGSYYYGFMRRTNNVYIAELNRETGEIVSPPEKAIQHFEGYNQAPCYSPDGKYLAYISRRSPLSTLPNIRYSGNVLCIKSLETGKEREFRPALDLFGFPSWSPDGSSLIVVHWNYLESIELCQIDAQTGNVTLVNRPEDNCNHSGGHQWSPSGETIYFGLRDREADSWNIIARDLESGNEKIIYQSDKFFTLSISPDGQWLALCCPSGENPRLNIISTTGGESRELCSFEEGIKLGQIPSTTWTADGKYILFGMCDPEVDDETYELCRIPVSGGAPEKLGLKMKSVFLNLSVHPDGQHITFSSSESIVEIWVMENFLSE
jgi:Tol biopolymer transport system component